MKRTESSEDTSTQEGSYGARLQSSTSFDSEEELKHEALPDDIEDEKIFIRLMEWMHSRGIERGEPLSIFEDSKQKNREKVSELIQTNDPNLNNSMKIQKKSSLQSRRPPGLNVKTSVRV